MRIRRVAGRELILTSTFVGIPRIRISSSETRVDRARRGEHKEKVAILEYCDTGLAENDHVEESACVPCASVTQTALVFMPRLAHQRGTVTTSLHPLPIVYQRSGPSPRLLSPPPPLSPAQPEGGRSITAVVVDAFRWLEVMFRVRTANRNPSVGWRYINAWWNLSTLDVGRQRGCGGDVDWGG